LWRLLEVNPFCNGDVDTVGSFGVKLADKWVSVRSKMTKRVCAEKIRSGPIRESRIIVYREPAPFHADYRQTGLKGICRLIGKQAGEAT
jgi:hypothetical protein